MARLKVGYACLARLSFDAQYAQSLFEESKKCLAAMDIELVHVEGLTVTEDDARAVTAKFIAEGVDVALIQYATFSLGTLMPMFAQQLNMPLVLWGVPEPSLGGGRLRSNSLCGINMNAHTLMRLKRTYDYVFCRPTEVAEHLAPVFSAVHCVRRLLDARLGLVGYRVPGFYTSTCDELELRRRVGVEVHHVTLEEVFAEARAIDAASRQQEVEAARAQVGNVDVRAEELDKAAALYLAFKRVAERHHLDALAVKCWPEFPDHYGIAACATLSRLNNDGLLTSCEGDVYGAVTMLMEHYLTGQTPMFADFVAIDEEQNTGIAWHCGAAPVCLAADDAQVQISKHPSVDGGFKKGVTMDFPVKDEGPVTMARLSVGPEGLRMFLAGGQAVKMGRILCGNPLGIRFHIPVRRLLETIMEQGLEHHYVLVHADIRNKLLRVAKWLQLDTLDVDAQ